MKHLKTIRELVESEKLEEAQEAIDNLLILGGKNTEAMKIKARIYQRQGHFSLEAQEWRKIIDLDAEDEDAIGYYEGLHLEERENYYFTQTLGDGSKRFLAYPYKMAVMSAYGLMGCLLFLIITRLGYKFPIFLDPYVLLGTFFVLIIGPWFGIIYTFMTSLQFAQVDGQKVILKTRLRLSEIYWSELAELILTFDPPESADENVNYELLFLPKISKPTKKMRCYFVSLHREFASLQARHYFLKEVSLHFPMIRVIPRKQLENDKSLDKFRIVRFD